VVSPAATAAMGPWSKDIEGNVTVEAALWVVRGGDGTAEHLAAAGNTVAPAAARETIARRLKGYPGIIKKHMHKAYAVLPRRLAMLLNAEPQLIAPAVEAFYERDPNGLKVRPGPRRCQTQLAGAK